MVKGSAFCALISEIIDPFEVCPQEALIITAIRGSSVNLLKAFFLLISMRARCNEIFTNGGFHKTVTRRLFGRYSHNKKITMRKIVALLVTVLCTSTMGITQKDIHTIHLDALMHESTESNSSFKLQLTKTAGTSYKGIIYDYSNTIKAEGSYVLVGKKYLEDGYFTYFYQNGKIESEGNFVRGVKVGTWKRFDNNGKKKSDRYYPEEGADKIRDTMKLEKIEDEK